MMPNSPALPLNIFTVSSSGAVTPGGSSSLVQAISSRYATDNATPTGALINNVMQQYNHIDQVDVFITSSGGSHENFIPDPNSPGDNIGRVYIDTTQVGMAYPVTSNGGVFTVVGILDHEWVHLTGATDLPSNGPDDSASATTDSQGRPWAYTNDELGFINTWEATIPVLGFLQAGSNVLSITNQLEYDVGQYDTQNNLPVIVVQPRYIYGSSADLIVANNRHISAGPNAHAMSDNPENDGDDLAPLVASAEGIYYNADGSISQPLYDINGVETGISVTSVGGSNVFLTGDDLSDVTISINSEAFTIGSIGNGNIGTITTTGSQIYILSSCTGVLGRVDGFDKD